MVTVTTARARQGDALDGRQKPQQDGMNGPVPCPPRTKLLEARLASQSPQNPGVAQSGIQGGRVTW